ncbi:aliphatic sulfonate ABC transporter substrate-binding protein, partial [Serratia bockelmannii]|nr:aliphatic sulfonate ABC transporter substrate-binding protein [Serratia bockelmannii]
PTTITPVSAHTAQAQQQTADLFYANHLMPVKVNIADRIWHPQSAQP